MSDQCRHCTFRGDFTHCQEADCFMHENWAAIQLREENYRMREALEKIATWQQAYPLDIFPEPDLKRAHQVLKSFGMGIDGISASNMRHVLMGIKNIVDAGLGK